MRSVRARFGVIVAVVLALAFGLTVPARADSVTDLGANLVPMGLNNSDQVVGDLLSTGSTSSDQAALWNGSLQMLGPLSPGDQTDAYAISAGGRIAGDDINGSSVHGAYWNGGGNANQVGPFGGLESNDDTVINGVDTAGDLVGFSPDAGSVDMGFFDRAGAAVTVGGADLGSQVGGTSVGAITPNGSEMLGDTSTSTGETYYLWSTANPSGPGTKLDITPAEDNAALDAGAEFGSGISNSLASDGTVLGYKGSGPSKTYYTRLPSGVETKVTGLFHANAVNASHVVAGEILTASNVEHAAIWSNGAVTDLNTLLPAGTADWILLEASAINDNGDIAGLALHNGKDVGFLLSAGASASVKFGAIPQLQVEKTVSIPVTVTAGPVDLNSVSLGDGLSASGPHAKVTGQPSGIDGFALSAGESKTFTFKLKGVSEGDAPLSVSLSGTSAHGNVSDSATATAQVFNASLIVTDVKVPSEREPSESIDIKYKGIGWNPAGGPIEMRFSAENAGRFPGRSTFEGTLKIRKWPKRTTDDRAIEAHRGGGYCYGEFSATQGDLFDQTKVEGKWAGWVLWSASPEIKAHEAWCEGEEDTLFARSPHPIVVMGLFKGSSKGLDGLALKVYGSDGAGTASPTILLHHGNVLNYDDHARDTCVAVSVDHEARLITTVTRGRCL